MEDYQEINKYLLKGAGNITSLACMHVLAAYKNNIPIPEAVIAIAKQEAYLGARLVYMRKMPEKKHLAELNKRPKLTKDTNLGTPESNKAVLALIEQGFFTDDANSTQEFLDCVEAIGWIKVVRKRNKVTAVMKK